MPFCPKCRYEYNPGVGRCPDCDEQLVDYLPAEGSQPAIMQQYDNWIQLARFTSIQYAQMLLEGLNAKEIPCVLLSAMGYHGSMGFIGEDFVRPMSAGISIMIPEEYVLDADREASLMLGDIWEKSKLYNVEE